MEILICEEGYGWKLNKIQGVITGFLARLLGRETLLLIGTYAD